MSTPDIKRFPVELGVHNTLQVVFRLDRQLPFSRKPANLQQVEDDLYSTPCTVYVERDVVLTAEEFDTFAADFYQHQPWLEDRGGSWTDGMLCVQVSAPERPVLFVNGAGYGYARYVARLG